MMRPLRYWLLAMLAWALAPSVPANAVDYLRDVKPILQAQCFSCHGSLRQKSGLRLDHVTFMREGGDRGSGIAATSAESPLIQAVRGTLDTKQMPLDGKPLTEAQIATLAAWIDEGAPAPDEKLPDDPRKHWAFQRPVRPSLPAVKNPAWAEHPVDRFLATVHEERGLDPSPNAPKNVLLRRVYLDLIGLPPSASELHEFVADDAPDAYERLVDRLLASPRYGERWGRHWMDVWRYSDWDGYGAEVRESQPHIWRWRDWIIQSLNADRPYDEMICEMLAADELAPDDGGKLAATGFLVRNWFRFNRDAWLDGIVEHTSKAFLGITLNCARCHDHMFDPILQTEYYQFRAVFEPHDVRTDRLPGQSDTKLVGLARVFDANAAAPTYLFERGNQARPDKDHPLLPAVPRVLGGGELRLEPVTLPAVVSYPGLRDFVHRESLIEAQAQVEHAEAALAQASAALTETRKKIAKLAARPAADAATSTATAPAVDAASPPAATTATTENTLRSSAAAAESGAAIAEQEMLTAAARLVEVRSKITADKAAFATPPATEAKALAREASRAEHVHNAERTKMEVLRLERDRSAIAADGDEAAKKKAADLDTKLTAARKAHEDAQAALGTPSESYTRFTPEYPATSTGRRAALARWIASKDNPLTARVAINHIWLRHFGSPLVPTVFDFGLAGKSPTHPALLDWLATELMDNGWRMKEIHRLIVTSRAYRMQSAVANESNLARDPENQYLWRMNVRRMEAEVVRDSTLRVSGALDETMFGPELEQNLGLTVPRRSVYFRSSKEKKVTFLEMFDSPNVTDCYRRSETVVPQQALAMVNSSLSLAQARRLAAGLASDLRTREDRESLTAFVGAAFECILCRKPTSEESTACLEFLDRQSRRLADAASLVAFELGKANDVKPAADPPARARENLIHVLLNHNDFVTIR